MKIHFLILALLSLALGLKAQDPIPPIPAGEPGTWTIIYPGDGPAIKAPASAMKWKFAIQPYYGNLQIWSATGLLDVFTESTNVETNEVTISSDEGMAFFRASESNGLQVALGWNASPSTNVAGYTIYEGGQPGNYTNEIYTSGTNLAVGGLQPNSQYYFAGAAVNSQGIQSALSAECPYNTSNCEPPKLTMTQL